MAATSEHDDALPVSPVVRVLRPPLAAAIALGSLFWAADLYRAVGILFLPEQFLAAIFGTGLALIFLHFPARRGTSRGPLPWYDGLLAATGFLTGWYVAFDFADISSRLFEAPLKGLVTATIFFLLTVEGLRRTLGWPLVVILLFFMGYSLVGHLVPGDLQTREVQLGRMMVYLGIDTSGLFGLIMLVGVTVVIPFLFFGQLLSASGGAGFFNDLSLGLMGRRRGGAAKISVLASSLFGTISGVVVSNILATGVITIPLMKKSGFSARHAAAIEATASTGGQLMPPVMGAVAFLMADFLQRPYSDIVIAALVPAILYYIALFIQADLVAARSGIRRLDSSEIPRLGPVLASGLVFALPFAVLIYLLFWANREPEFAALAAALAVAAIGLVLGYKGRRMKLRGLSDALVSTGIASLEILMIAAAAGFIAGILQATGLGFALTLLLVKIGGGNIVALLVIAAILCILLGMGMPTLGVYVLLAVLIAPSLIEVGIPPLAAHMFILYLGMMSMITPPVAIGAFFAASLAGAEPMRTGFAAMRFGWTAYIVPFLFVFSPSLLLQNPSVVETMVALVTAVAGVWLVSAGIAGFIMRPLAAAVRSALVLAGLCLLVPDEIGAWAQWTDGAGLVLAALALGCELVSIRRGRATASGAAPRPR
jgi:TRAP transporter 4TM/12TM fusion protein